MSKAKVEWTNKGEAEDFDAAANYLALLTSDVKAKAVARELRKSRPVEHAAKDLLRAARLPLLPRDEPHVAEDLKRIEKGKPLPHVLVVRGDMGRGLPLVVADGYHRICAVVYFDENAPVSCRVVSLAR